MGVRADSEGWLVVPLSVGNLEPSPAVEPRIDRPGTGSEQRKRGCKNSEDDPTPTIFGSCDRIAERHECNDASCNRCPEARKQKESEDCQTRVKEV